MSESESQKKYTGEICDTCKHWNYKSREGKSLGVCNKKKPVASKKVETNYFDSCPLWDNGKLTYIKGQIDDNKKRFSSLFRPA